MKKIWAEKQPSVSKTWTSEIRTPPYLGHLHIQGTYCGPICMLTNLWNQDTSIKWTPEMVSEVSGLDRFQYTFEFDQRFDSRLTIGKQC